MVRVFTQTFGAVGGLIEKDGKIALVQEAVIGKPDDGKWNHPAGWLNVGENPITGAKREIEEETGFIFTPTAVLGIYSLVRKDIEKQLNGTMHPIKIIFIGDIKIEKQNNKFSEEITDLKWFTPEEIYAMDNATLREIDIKQMVKDYFSGKQYPLDLIHHLTQK
ncbi:MAG: NUDIX domain-containing protein [bacterium]